jgi:predicted anti-sigma-YlaC factor YlaD
MNVYLKNIALAFLALFMITILTGHPTFAGSSTQLGSTHSLPPEETTLDSSTAQTIALYSTIGGYTSYNYYGS